MSACTTGFWCKWYSWLSLNCLDDVHFTRCRQRHPPSRATSYVKNCHISFFMSHTCFSLVRVRVVKTYCICCVCVLSLAWCRTSTTGGVLTYLCCVVFDIRFLRSLIHYIFTVHLLHVFSRFSCHCFRYMSACCCCCNVIAVWVWKRGRASSAVQSTRC